MSHIFVLKKCFKQIIRPLRPVCTCRL